MKHGDRDVAGKCECAGNDVLQLALARTETRSEHGSAGGETQVGARDVAGE